jgi:hypothetical protein
VIELLLLAVPFKENFLMDSIVPGIALIFVLILILNSVLNRFGYKLF